MEAASEACEFSRETLHKIFTSDRGGLPPWLGSPDFNNPVFINAITKLLWPRIDKAGTEWAFTDRRLETMLNNETFWKPSWLAASGIVLQSLVLGHKPPVVTDVKIYPLQRGSTSTAIVADMAFTWNSKMEIKLAMKSLESTESKSLVDKMLSVVYRTITVKAVIRNLIARGHIRVTMTPLLDSLPVVGGMHVCFLDPPAISYEVSSFGANPLLVPGLESWMKNFISHQVMNPFTYPDGFDINVQSLLGIDGHGPHLHPQGFLAVTIKSASGVPRTDIFGLCDPYVKVFVKQSEQKSTTVRSNTLSPVWEEEFDFLIHDIAHQSLQLHLFDSEALRQDTFLGSVSVPLGKVQWTNSVADIVVPVELVWKKKQKDNRAYDRVVSSASKASEITEEDYIPTSDATNIIYTRDIQTKTPSGYHQQIGYNITDVIKTISGTKDCNVHLRIEFIKFSDSEANLASDAATGSTHDECDESQLSRRALRFLHGGMLYIHLSRAINLKSGTQVTKKFKIVLSIVRQRSMDQDPLYVRVSEKSGLGKSMNARDPIFDDSLDILIDGDTAADPDVALRVEVFVIHFARKPKSRGHAIISLKQIIRSGRIQDRWDLFGGDKNRGQIEMVLHWLPTMHA